MNSRSGSTRSRPSVYRGAPRESEPVRHREVVRPAGFEPATFGFVVTLRPPHRPRVADNCRTSRASAACRSRWCWASAAAAPAQPEHVRLAVQDARWPLGAAVRVTKATDAEADHDPTLSVDLQGLSLAQ